MGSSRWPSPRTVRTDNLRATINSWLWRHQFCCHLAVSRASSSIYLRSVQPIFLENGVTDQRKESTRPKVSRLRRARCFPSKPNHRVFDRKKPQNHHKKSPICSFSISEPVTTDKFTYVNCQSKSPRNHRKNFLSRLSVLLTVKPPILFLRCGGLSVSLTAKPPILFMENFGKVFF